MATYNFYLKDKHSNKETPIFLYVRWDKKLLKFYIQESINPKYWQIDKKKENYQRAIRTKDFPEYPEFNTRLDEVIGTVKTVFRRFQNDNDQKKASVKELKELLNIEFQRVEKNEVNLFNFYQSYIDNAKAKYSLKTIQWYENSLTVLTDFQKGYDEVIDFDTINMDFYNEFINYLTFIKEYKQNTIGKHIQNLKAVLNSATIGGKNSTMVFKSPMFKKPTENSIQIHLNEKEIEEIYLLDLSNDKRLERVRDLFIVGCWTGLRYSDFSKLRKENFRDGFINVDINKTKEQGLIIPIHPFVKQVMVKYQENENSLPTAISDDKMRKYLKEIGEKIPSLKDYCIKSFTKKGERVDVQKRKHDLIGTHTARRSFATNMYNEDNGIDTLDIMAITNHKTEKAFLTYIKTTKKEPAIKIKNHWEEKYSYLKVVS
jgi:integrase